ncbi:major facilitator superfamily domain-containing protein [Penicillium malachiteum]|uniref:Major facilitator superfamily domain-containing protein n=1 Tax=Penicillium malachiteum TaxID=1324776 RepID=A0AAD6MUB7_9EURO|nr:major facilitator superfamily domain-containing protein [Penicillium malachiteum]
MAVPNGEASTLNNESQYLRGWKLFGLTFSLLASLYLVNLESTIISTSLVAIAEDFQSFNKTSWFVTAYIMTYTGFIVLWNRISDTWGMKGPFISALCIFLAFSLGCGLAQTETQLIICRAFQGLGGGGTYTLVMLSVYQLVPQQRLPVWSGMVAITISLATLTGPIIGGALANSDWRWIFYLNLPPGGLIVILLFLSMPGDFLAAKAVHNKEKVRISPVRFLWDMDILGVLLLSAGSFFLITVLDETNSQFAWSSPTAIVLVVMSAIFWALFFTWEFYPQYRKEQFRPLLPKRLLCNAPLLGILFTSFVVGVPYNTIAVYLPQRFQILMGDTPLVSGLRLVAYTGVTALSSSIAIVLSTKFQVPFIYILALSAAFSIIGSVLLSTLPESNYFPAAGYGYEVLTGCGMGIAYGIAIFAVPYLIDGEDLAEASGAAVQMRYLGNAIGVAISSNILNGRFKAKMSGIVGPDMAQRLLQDPDRLKDLTPSIRHSALQNFAQSYKAQFQVLIGFGVAQFVITFMLWRRKGPQLRPKASPESHESVVSDQDTIA